MLINAYNHTKWLPAVIMYRAAVTNLPRVSRVKIAEEEGPNSARAAIVGYQEDCDFQ